LSLLDCTLGFLQCSWIVPSWLYLGFIQCLSNVYSMF
jgi:hypothetical protein